MASVGAATKDRHRVALLKASEGLAASQELLEQEAAVDLVAEELRRAITALDSLVGRVDVEHILDEIFSSFCIGK